MTLCFEKVVTIGGVVETIFNTGLCKIINQKPSSNFLGFLHIREVSSHFFKLSFIKGIYLLILFHYL